MVHKPPMITTQRLPPSLTPLEAALAMLRDGLAPVAASALPLAEALGCVAADMPPLHAVPARDLAAVDGWALRARDLVGASSYSPLPLARPPPWVEAGDAVPGNCDCVVDADLVEVSGPLAEAVAEAIPGQGVRRAGEDVAEASGILTAGLPLRGLDQQGLRTVIYVNILPNVLLSLHPDYVMTHRLIPVAVDRTRIECQWLFPPEAIARGGFDPSYAVEFWDLTNRQDWQVCELSQAGIGSRAYVPGPYSNREDLLYAFDRFIVELHKTEGR